MKMIDNGNRNFTDQVGSVHIIVEQAVNKDAAHQYKQDGIAAGNRLELIVYNRYYLHIHISFLRDEMPPHLFVHNRFLQTRQHQQRRKKEAEQRNVIHPSPSKAVIPIKQVLIYLSEVTNREQVGGIMHRSVHRGHGKSHP